MNILVTGAAGFIGMHVSLALLRAGHHVHGIDNLNNYYDPQLKRERLARLRDHAGFTFERVDIADTAAVDAVFAARPVQRVVHLAAQAGVRYSVLHPHAVTQSNLVGFTNVIEAARRAKVDHFVYASSSSVYGGNTKLPFAEDDPVDHPVSLYAATKKANELTAHAIAHLHGLPCTGLRFFTVYGPWGRPDMAYWGFTEAILAGRPIAVYNHGHMSRDFTYIDDVVDAVIAVVDRPPVRGDDGAAPQRVLNIGSRAPVVLPEFIGLIETALGRSAILDPQPMQPGDVPATYASTANLEALIGRTFETTPLDAGLPRFVDWYVARASVRARLVG